MGCIELVDGLFRAAKGGRLSDASGYTLHYGDVVDGAGGVVDDVVVSLYRAPHSYTSEDCVEISCHGSAYIVNRIIEQSLACGARLAEAGEFTMRAFMAGRMDLSQAEAVADVISSSSRATHHLASTQMRGGYSQRLSELRGELIRLCSLLELELDFSDEDVEFADRGELNSLMTTLMDEIAVLCESFKVGNAIKEGVAVAIVGEPNVGKSTLLNRLLGDDRAIVSSVAGTTRDTIEEVLNIDGVVYRFIDTAGLRVTSDELERIGIERTHEVISRAQIVIQMTDVDRMKGLELLDLQVDQRLIVVVNKGDLLGGESDGDSVGLMSGCDLSGGGSGNDSVSGDVMDIYTRERGVADGVVLLSARDGVGVDELLSRLRSAVDLERLYGGDIVVSNARHYGHLRDAYESLSRARTSLAAGLSADLLSDDIRHTLHHIGSITGSITTDDILTQIFSTFCIGK